MKEAFIKLDSDTLRSRGFGFVTFQSPEDSQKAIDGGPHHLDGKNLDVKHAIPHHLTTNPQYTASNNKYRVAYNDASSLTFLDFFILFYIFLSFLDFFKILFIFLHYLNFFIFFDVI